MEPTLKPALATPHTLTPTYGMPRPEAEIIDGRIASHRHWTRRRRALRLRAAVFGRRKHAGGAEGRPSPRQAQNSRPAATA